MKKNLAVDVPRDAETEVDRIRGLKKSIFTRTRIACLCLVMVLALSVSSTLAYEKWSGNATPNRGYYADTELIIGEGLNGNAISYTVSETGNDVTQGASNKKVRVKMANKPNIVDSYVTVALVPMAGSTSFNQASDPNGTQNPTTNAYYNNPAGTPEYGYAFFDQTWSGSSPVYEGGKWYIETDVMRLYLSNDWNNTAADPAGKGGCWVWSDGAFKYSVTRSAGQETQNLLEGVVFREGVNVENDYTYYQVQVVAQVTAASSGSTES